VSDEQEGAATTGLAKGRANLKHWEKASPTTRPAGRKTSPGSATLDPSWGVGEERLQKGPLASTSSSSTNSAISRSPKPAANCYSISSAGSTNAPRSSSPPISPSANGVERRLRGAFAERSVLALWSCSAFDRNQTLRSRPSYTPIGGSPPSRKLLPSAFVAESLYADRGFMVWSRAPWGTGFLH
jgi:hypothetical protein